MVTKEPSSKAIKFEYYNFLENIRRQNKEWNDIGKEILTNYEIEELIDNFIDRMPLKAYDEKDINYVFKLTYQTGLILAFFSFYKEEKLIEKKCETCGKVYYIKEKKSRWCPDCVQKMLKELRSNH